MKARNVLILLISLLLLSSCGSSGGTAEDAPDVSASVVENPGATAKDTVLFAGTYATVSYLNAIEYDSVTDAFFLPEM
ncbi:MAG: hypothetical protein LIO42_07000 [Oscillospiraceae bacterium]|nr:hypothetical protein [Oscillospiraceae bacterium]